MEAFHLDSSSSSSCLPYLKHTVKLQYGQQQSFVCVCDPNVVFKCSHHKDAKYLERECKNEHCLNHIFFWLHPSCL